MQDEPLTFNQKVREILFRYRATPLACGKSPAELYLHRTIRINLDALKPFKYTTNYQKIPGTRSLTVGERVQARYYSNLKPTWKFGTVIEKYGQLHYLIKLDNGYIFKRHIDQLRNTEVKKKSVRFSPDTKEEEEEINPGKNLSTELGHYMEFPRTAPVTAPAEERDENEDQTRITPDLSTDNIKRSQRSHRVPSHLHDYIVG